MLYIGLLLITSLLLGLNIYKIRLASVIILDKYRLPIPIKPGSKVAIIREDKDDYVKKAIQLGEETQSILEDKAFEQSIFYDISVILFMMTAMFNPFHETRMILCIFSTILSFITPFFMYEILSLYLRNKVLIYKEDSFSNRITAVYYKDTYRPVFSIVDAKEEIVFESMWTVSSVILCSLIWIYSIIYLIISLLTTN